MCLTYFKCMSYIYIYIIKHEIVIPRSSAGSADGKGALQYGIRAKVLTMSLDGPFEWSLDRGFEEKLCLEDQFQTFECS